MRTLLVANRGEVALRVLRAARSLGVATVGVASQDDAGALHAQRYDRVVALPGTGPAAYLDVAAVVAAGVSAGADALHPGYGLLSESAELARACAAAGLTFVGPSLEVLEVLGDKVRTRALAQQLGVPVTPGTAAGVEEVSAFARAELAAGRAVVVKALAGGGGRGMRVVRALADLPAAVEACRAEALTAFGRTELYAERLVEGARHVEVQVVGDGVAAGHLWDRDCSVQRRHAKQVEVAPSGLDSGELLADAVRLAAAVGLRGVATVEFLVPASGGHLLLEVNPRLQVEHTVTEQVTGVDLVVAQLRLAAGESLVELGLDRVRPPSGCAIQVRLHARGAGTPSGLVWPTGAGVRVDTAAAVGLAVSDRFDPLLAKVVVHDRGGFQGALRLARQALAETCVEGLDTDLDEQAAVLASEAFAERRVDTGWLDRQRLAGPVVVGGQVRAPTAGAVVAVEVQDGQAVGPGAVLVVVEAMKMQHPVVTDRPGTVGQVRVRVGDLVRAGDVLLQLDATGDERAPAAPPVDLDRVRPELQALLDRRALLLDAARPEAVARRHLRGRTARENVDDLTDAGLEVEYGGLAVAAQRAGRSLEDLVARTPADGVVTGLGRVGGVTTAVAAYDGSVLAGSQGMWGHRKLDRLLEVARERRSPFVLFAEGAGGRPSDTDVPVVAGLDLTTWVRLGALSGLVPTVGIAHGYCFAGNAALLGSCDVVIATEGSSIGLAGPAMIEGAGLGTVRPQDVGPVGVQRRNGVVDVVVADEAAAVAVAQRYLAFFGEPPATWAAPDPRLLRHVVPEDRMRVYDVRAVLTGLFDLDSVLELRAGFGPGVVTALARLEGRSVGVLANDPAVLGGAVDAAACDKAARFLQLCDAHGLPVVSLCDTPGFMVGPDAEQEATVRHAARLFVLAGHLTVPCVTVVLRKGYGLGAMAMAAGSFRSTSLTVAWPTAEFGAMGLEGAVTLAARGVLEAIEDPEQRRRTYDELVAFAYAQGSAVNTASLLEVDDVIDPITTRDVLVAALAGPRAPGSGRWIDTW